MTQEERIIAGIERQITETDEYLRGYIRKGAEAERARIRDWAMNQKKEVWEFYAGYCDTDERDAVIGVLNTMLDFLKEKE